MANGRCHYHGGKTPKGEQWHRMQLPDKTAPNAWRKTEGKLWKAEKDRKAREKRLARMTPEELATHKQWHRDHPIGTPAFRERKRLERQQNEDFRKRHAIVPATTAPATSTVNKAAKPPAPAAVQAATPDLWEIFR